MTDMSDLTSDTPLSADIVAEEYYIALQDALRGVRETFLKRRNTHGVTQQAIADRLGWNKALVSRRLHARGNLTFKTLSALATAMDCRLKVDYVPYEEMAASNYQYDASIIETSTPPTLRRDGEAAGHSTVAVVITRNRRVG
jgi:transcriptional regulator with XRE-family HTH domain